MTVDKFIKRPKTTTKINQGRYEKYNLKENPFPSSPFVNRDSTDVKSNGKIYEPSIRKTEYDLICQNFLQVPQINDNHLRLGYILDTSYIGRGNGKSTFLLNLQREINLDYCLSISRGENRCFALTLIPEPGGKTKTFDNFINLLVNEIFRLNLIDDSLASLRLEAILKLDSGFNLEGFEDEDDIRKKMTSEDWFKLSKIDYREVDSQIRKNEFLQDLPQDFPLGSDSLFHEISITSQEDFRRYYNALTVKDRPDFVFNHLVNLFLAAGFNGAYIFVDDFERIPDFQSERQKRDFAVQARHFLFDGLSTNARVGFYVMIFVLHAGVPRLIQDAWLQSGLEQRAPITSKVGVPSNIIRFEKITDAHIYSLIQKYLSEYRIGDKKEDNSYFPFNQEALAKMGKLSEFNASRILKMAHELLENAIRDNKPEIDLMYLDSILKKGGLSDIEQKPGSGIHKDATIDLQKEIGSE